MIAEGGRDADGAGSSPPLAGLRVVDLAVGPMAAIGRNLVELGAEVIRIEPRAGAADRAAGPSVDGISLAFVAANLGKRAVALDLSDRTDCEHFEAVLVCADILIETTEPGSADAETLDVASIRRRHPALVILSASGFGAQTSFRQWHATSPVYHALSGELSRSGIPGCPPLLPPGDLANACAVAQAVYVILLAYYRRLNTGLGDHLDFAVLDAATQALDPGYGIAGSAMAGVPASELPRDRPEARHMYPIIPCKDGFVRLCVLAPRQWRGLFEWMGRPEEFADSSYDLIQTRFESPTLLPAIARFFAGKARAELEEAGQHHGVPAAAVLSLEEALASDHFRARQAFAPVEIAPGVIASFANGIVEIDGKRAGIRGGAPKLSEHQAILSELVPKRAETSPAGRSGRPLEGLRVLDLGVIIVGAEQGRLLADQGAEVIKVENRSFPDGSRQSRFAGPISVTFAAGHRNKKSLALDLRQPEGKALFVKLAAKADVILSNFKPGTLESLGLDYEVLSALNPRIVMADSSAFGATGPWSKRLGYGPLVRASAGLTAQWRYSDDPGSFSDAITVYPDHVAGRVGAAGVLALLVRRLRTGRGGTVSVSQAEVMLNHMATQIAAGALTDAGKAVVGGLGQDAPWGVFPCSGDDEWCAVTVRGDNDWAALCGAIERPDLAVDPALCDAAGRCAARARIEAALCAWLAVRSSREAMEQLQTAGVPAGAMLRVSELPDFSFFVERRSFRLFRQDHVDKPFYTENAPVLSQNLPDPPLNSAPLMGQDGAAIMRDWLGLSQAEIERLVAAKVLEMPADLYAAKAN